MSKIVLVGYMGSGKSTIGRALAQRVALEFIDLDDLIVEEEGKTIKEIFETKGEIYFRKLEHIVLKKQLLKKESFVLSLGGGTPCYAGNHLLLQEDNVNSIYLKASVQLLVARLIMEADKRPLVANLNKEEMGEFVAKHLFDRSYYYNSCKKVVSVDNKTVDVICDDLIALLF
ncbi:shikimate kinase [Flavobacterium columnare]|uniref:Shikimate kinase n=1 Tax=Flavobacterium columnare (strain ATCC 49512 / CIP 103533 / TG 44/87) TaxID=1041826 RepID=G8X7R1_FLACA|nr:shikimate kinase [Flavobacterium columnare]AEW86394.1 shikimate kinase [Flavobacterium columnare ATCC 49512]MBF6653673.1 shikimate kinase [Flavobacterium columnare]MBF6656514.1 shikimate kinase [Flavobacterium columnare]MBF6659180.1 shikimate kinase [Flavobacterium columnare]OOB81820.1 shikimate kinase [Flavobacterium columnare]